MIDAMPFEPIIKSPSDWKIQPNLRDYPQARAAFSWDDARRDLNGLPCGWGINIAHEAIDRHTASGRGAHLAIRWLGKTGKVEDFTFAKLTALTNRFANVLVQLGVGTGDRVYSLAGRIPELYITALGTLKNRGIFCPLFSAFGPEPLRTRLNARSGNGNCTASPAT